MRWDYGPIPDDAALTGGPKVVPPYTAPRLAPRGGAQIIMPFHAYISLLKNEMTQLEPVKTEKTWMLEAPKSKTCGNL